jgi:hypothetical protein
MAETVRNNSRSGARAWWGLMALGGFVVAFACRLLVPRRSHAETQSNAPAAKNEDHEKRTASGQQENPTTAFEPSDWSLRPVALIYLGIPVLLVISCFVLIAAYPNALPDVGRSLRIAPPGPPLQTDAEGDLQKFRADEERRLNTYYWIDEQKGIVHIPIEQAMKKLATAGAPGFPKGQGQP